MTTLLSWIHQGFSTAVPFIILLGLVIFVHEFGHFIVAKWCGVRVEVFSMGFGRKIFKYKRGDTTYCISLIPLGGYVKMFGDEIGADLPAAERKYAFTHKKIWQRFSVVLAGPMMNFFFAIFVFSLVALVGEDMHKPNAGDVAVDSAAYKAGIRSGDEVLKVNGQAVPSWESLQDVLNKNIGQNVSLDLHRQEGNQDLHVQAKPEARANPNPISLDSVIGEVDGFSTQSRAAVLGVVAGSLAEKYGFKTGDRIVTVNNHEVIFYRELENLLVSMQGQSVSVQVERLDPVSLEERTAIKTTLSVPLGAVASLASLGIESGDLYLAKVMENSPAAAAGVKAGDRILAVDGKYPNRWEDVLNAVKSYGGSGNIKLKLRRLDQTLDLEMTPAMTAHTDPQGIEEKRYTVGIMPWIQSAPPQIVKIYADGFSSAISRGFHKTNEFTAMTLLSFVRIVQNKLSPKNLGGVVAIGQAASETFKIGLAPFLGLMGLISVNLFIINLLPIPVLDGGHLLFYTIEALRGAPLSMRKLEVAQQIGLVILLSLMALSIFNDISRVAGN